VSHTFYDRDVLRQQMNRLRQAAAERTKLEQDITSEYEKETAAARAEADTAIAATEKKYARESEATRREHAAVKVKADADAAADRAKLDSQHKSVATTIRRNWEKQDAQLKEDAQFEENQSKEVFKEKRKEPAIILKRAEKELANIATQLDQADSRSLKFLASCGVVAAPPANALLAAAHLPSTLT